MRHSSDVSVRTSSLEYPAPIRIDVGSFFAADHKLMKMNGSEDFAFSGEDELVRASQDYDIVVADPLYFRAVKAARTVPLPHRALSAQLYVKE